MVVDAHHHFWDPGRAHYAWLTDERAAIRRPFGPEDLRPLLGAHGIDRTIVIEARSSVEETRELLALAAATDFLAGVVGWVDLTGDAVAASVAHLRAGEGGSHLVGIRHQVRAEPDPEWLLRPEVLRGLSALAEAGLVYDLLVNARELSVAREAARRVPSLRVVVEHLGAPRVRQGDDPEWAAGMAPIAELPNVSCKVSGLVVGTAGMLAPFVDRLIDWFGEERLLFGSDWPVCLLGATYDEIVGRFDAVTRGLSAAGRAGALGENARRIYGLG
jgi:L-fuconolactonase